jgi:hypothetical protein
MFDSLRLRLAPGFGLSALCLLVGVACGNAGGSGTTQRISSGGSGGTATGGGSGTPATGGSTASGGVAGSATATGGAGGNGMGGAAAGGASGAPGAGGATGVSGTSNGGSAGAVSCTPGTGTTDIDGDTVLDNHTCLTWQKTVHATALMWADENQYCQDLTQGGFDDWRMPTLEEISTWPIKGPDGGNIMTAPRYVGADWTDEQKNTQFHVCMRTFYLAGCGWQGPENVYGTVCVRGQAANLTSFDSVCDNTCTMHLAAYGCTGADCFVPWQ